MPPKKSGRLSIRPPLPSIMKDYSRRLPNPNETIIGRKHTVRVSASVLSQDSDSR
jgi:hypothetical protein